MAMTPGMATSGRAAPRAFAADPPAATGHRRTVGVKRRTGRGATVLGEHGMPGLRWTVPAYRVPVAG